MEGIYLDCQNKGPDKVGKGVFFNFLDRVTGSIDVDEIFLGVKSVFFFKKIKLVLLIQNINMKS
jgi:hypothetical protein